MDNAHKIGISFGLTSAVITTLGLMTGLEAGTGSKGAVVAGILTIAIADAFSDALGVHLAKESEGNFKSSQVWQATLATFGYKLLFALTFLVPAIFLEAPWSLYVAIAWGALILTVLNINIAKTNGERIAKVLGEHLGIAAAVVIISHLAGKAIASLF